MTTRTYPNVFWIALNLVCIFSLFVISWILAKVIRTELINPTKTADWWMPFAGIIIALGLISLGLIGIVLVSQRSCYVLFSDKGLTLIKPFRLFSKFYAWSDLRGYSTSQISFNAKDTLPRTDSVVIYTQNNSAHEIIKIYNFQFKFVQETLKAKNIVYFGTEKTAFYFRKYKFNNKNKSVAVKDVR